MQFIKPGINIDFIGKINIAFIVSIVLILVSLTTLIIHKGPRYGIDFAGGTMIQVKFKSTVNIDAVKAGLAKVNMAKASVQSYGNEGDNEFLIRTDVAISSEDKDVKEKTLTTALTDSTKAEVEIRRVEMVGPQVGKDLREKALMAMFFALLFITIYISGRFELKWLVSMGVAGALAGMVLVFKMFITGIPVLILAALIGAIILFWFLRLKYAMGAIVALVHDVTITVGIFSILGKEFTLPIIAALLTIIGYSLNDTIIVFDRIRENLRKIHKKPLDFILNRSINETLNRTILTSITTLIVVLILFLYGGTIIHDFAFALMIGIAVGTYSSIYVASPLLLAWQKFDSRK
ncbi:protein translocase subunit SecF [Desulfobacterales bacterium HSG16]|nr:protein translocase subunit SecF [Desulfobacterales bacterium HSG16]